MQAVMHRIKRLLAMAPRQPQPDCCSDLESAQPFAKRFPGQIKEVAQLFTIFPL
jgi:hypothetical protein